MKHILFLLLLQAPLSLFAQKTHKVETKESLFSIGRMYGVHPRELAEYNQIPFEEGVKVGQVLKIPAQKKMAPLPPEAPAAPVAAPSAPAPGPNKVPVYHKVQKKETLYQISTLYKNVTMEEIRKWNNLSGDALNEGSNLIVGYRAQDPVPAVAPKVPAPVAVATPAPKPPAPTPVVAPAPAPKPAAPAPPAAAVSGKITRNFSGGYFRNAFRPAADSRSETGLAATFKSTSGWDDGKYYCLHNTAPAGTILKITAPSTQKFVYAKVLDVIPDLDQNKGLALRLSNSAADELGVSADRFDVQLNY